MASCALCATPGWSSPRKPDLGGDRVDGVTYAPCGQRAQQHVVMAPASLTDQRGVWLVVQQDSRPRSRRSWWPMTGFWIQCLLLTLTYRTALFAVWLTSPWEIMRVKVVLRWVNVKVWTRWGGWDLFGGRGALRAGSVEVFDLQSWDGCSFSWRPLKAGFSLLRSLKAWVAPFQLIPLWWDRSVSAAASMLLLIPSSVIPPNLATMLYIWGVFRNYLLDKDLKSYMLKWWLRI